jgi:hypothetical protein
LRGCLRSKPANRFASFDEVAAAIAAARNAI